MPEQAFAGIDVAKDELVLACCDQLEAFTAGLRVPNTKAGIARLTRHLAKLGEVRVCLEPTSRYHLAVLAGLDPVPRESGQSRSAPRRISRQGNVALRRALYMPALSATHSSGPARAFYLGLLARGKKPLTALVALMRKLLTAIWGMFASNQPFDPTRFYPQPA